MRKHVRERIAAGPTGKPKRKLSPEHKAKLREASQRAAAKRRAEARAQGKIKLYGVEREPWKKETRGGKKKKYKRKTYIARRPKAVGYVVIDGLNRPLENILNPYGDTPRMKILLDGGCQATLFKSREMAQRAIQVTARFAQTTDLPEMNCKLDDVWKTKQYQVMRIVQ